MVEFNQGYFTKTMLATIKTSFKANKELPSVQLQSFISKNAYNSLQKEISKLKFKNEYVVLHHRYARAELPVKLQKEFVSKELVSFISSITGKKIKKLSAIQLQSTSYQIIDDRNLEKPGFDIIFDLSSDWDDSFGGSIVYVDGSGEYTKIPSQANSLLIVERKKGVQKFIQYVNHHAQKKKRVFLIATI
ncbi:MAG TPA: hypothetical protein VKE88_00045 [Candidatus Nanoarchaeia archaeon]|nr:hypothetical protein [Candidatus Nanoarchaeia archaeon]